MLLKKIKINGFKSFAQKTILNFVNPREKDGRPIGVTAIVGPNGSGKSNVADALKWVLGEQSMKSLRGKKAEDVIFAGSKQRARLGSAQVSLYLDNRQKNFPLDYEEVIITRKVYRSGESEYLINGSRVRLGDVLELLAEAGLGQKSYAIVDQGLTDRLLNATPWERKIIIEEAAGVKAYQLKKDRSQRKLKRTTTNLQRVRELLAEIEPHLNLLKRQYKKAQKGEVYLRQLKEKQEMLYRYLWKQLEERKEALTKEGKQWRDQEKALAAVVEKIFQKIQREGRQTSTYRQQAKNLEQEKRKFSQELNLLERELAIQEGKYELEKERWQKWQAIKIVPVNKEMISHQLTKIEEGQKRLVADLEKNIGQVLKEELWEKGKKLHQALVNLRQAVLQGKMKQKKSAAEIQRQQQQKEEVLAKMEKNLLGLQKKRKQLVAKIEQLEKQISDLWQQDNKERLAVVELESKLREKRFELDRCREKVNEYRVELAKIEVKEEDLRRQIEADLRISPEQLFSAEDNLPVENEEVNPEKLGNEIYRLKLKVEQIGNIDADIIEEYKETQERYDFLQGELNDLQEAMQKLQKVIRDLDKQIEEKFTLAFQRINKEFKKYFKIIFGGGQASLELKELPVSYRSGKNEEDQEDEEVEEATKEEKKLGVEIKVNPPGKKVSHLSLLSGGERALTSIALLFAIIAFNPPPFVFLDEVEAALDEANSQRFGDILRELSKKTQFIVITHNRQVMKEAGLLYGVTMQGDGVSELLSVELEKVTAE